MEERAFDALQKGPGPALLIGSTILLILIIFAGGMFMRYKEMEWRAAHKDESASKNDDPSPSQGAS